MLNVCRDHIAGVWINWCCHFCFTGSIIGEQLPGSKINLEVRAHKFAILDIAQRLPHDRKRFEAIAEQLGISKQQVEEIQSIEDVPEEQYYQVC